VEEKEQRQDDKRRRDGAGAGLEDEYWVEGRWRRGRSAVLEARGAREGLGL